MILGQLRVDSAQHALRILKKIVGNHVLTLHGECMNIKILWWHWNLAAIVIHNGTIQDTEYAMWPEMSVTIVSKQPSSIKRERQDIWLNKGSGNNDSAVIDHTWTVTVQYCIQ